MAFEITDNTKSIMDDLESGAAFDTSMLTDMGALNGQWAGLHAEQDSLFGTYSPIHGSFEGLDDTSEMSSSGVASLPFLNDEQRGTLLGLASKNEVLTQEQFDALGLPSGIDLRDGENRLLEIGKVPVPDAVSKIPFLASDQRESLVGKPAGLLSNLQAHAEGQFASITDNLSLYTTHQSVQNAMGNSQGCGGLTEHFGSIMSMGQGIAAAVKGAKGAIDEMKAWKNQYQSELNSFDENAIGILTGKINNPVLSRLVKGSGLHDQLDKILKEGGIAKDSEQAQQIRQEIGERLTPNLNDFYNKKSKVNEEVAKINEARGGILGQVSKELTVLNKATTTLRRLGAANSLQGLFKANECAQTLLGFVASSNFLGKLGQ